MQTANQILQQGRYRITQPLEQNETGAFYKAFDEVQKTNVVLKEFQLKLNKVTTLAQQEAIKLAFAAEARHLIGIKHETFLRVQDFFSEIDRQYLVLESVDGDSLNQLIERNKTPFALSDIANWADSLLDAISCLHAQRPSIIHRDIKPQNIKLLLNGKVKLDISNLGKGAQAKIGSTAANQNLHFLPLEQIWERLDPASQKVILNSYDEKSEEILKQPPDARSDIFALGATLYYLLTARLPVDALERSIDILEGKADPLPAPNRLNRNIPPETSDAVMKALEIKRENRFDSAVIMRQVLRTAVLRTKEREAEENAKSQTKSAAKIAAAAQNIQITEQDILEIETEPIAQVDLIKRLQEAEARRLEAEKRAAEAEKRLLERDAEQAQTIENPFIFAETSENTVQTSPPADVSPETLRNKIMEEKFSAGEGILFGEPEKESGGLKKLAVAAAILFVLGGAGFGAWSLLRSKSVEPNQTISTQVGTTGETQKPAPAGTIETQTASNAAPTPDADATTIPATTTTEPAKMPAVSPVVKNKPAAAPKLQKQAAQPGKTAAPEKKQVTVDDLINDN